MMVLPFQRTQPDMVPTYALFGKLPNRADFVRINATHPVVQEFDGLLQRGLEGLASEPGWEDAFDRLEPMDFYYASRDGRWVFIGVLKASHDQAKRRYPFVAGAILPTESVDGSAHLAPIAYEVFFDGLREQVTNAVDNSVEALACRQFLEYHLRARDTAAADVELARGLVERFEATERVARLDCLLRESAMATSLEQAVLNLAFYQSFIRRFDHSASHQMVLWPLPPEKGQEALVACAWLSLQVGLWGGGEGGLPWRGSFIRTHNAGANGVLAASFERIPEKYPKCIFGGMMDANVILDLACEQEAWRNHRLYAEVSYALARLLSDSELRFGVLRQFLSDIGQKLRRDA
jgi:type VI secretion system protein ImpM